MSKQLWLLGCLYVLVTNTAFAGCSSLMTEGKNAGSQGNSNTRLSNDSLAKMQDLIKQNASNKDICEKAQETRMASFLAAKDFKRSRSAYLKAVNECESPNDRVSAGNADTATESYNRNADLVAKLDKLMGSQCGRPPITPMLNGDNSE